MEAARGDAGVTAENVEVVRKVLDEWNRGDVQALLGRTSEDLEWHPALVESVEGGVFRGHDGFREFLRDWTSTWESWELEAEEIRELGEQVLVLTRVHAKGRGSGVVLDQSFAHLFEFREGLICRAQTFFDRDEALAVAQRRQEAA
jgi:ketosteroid isomerase-like protein